MIDYNKWENFKTNPPFKQLPYSKRNWGNKQHSLCSFYGKLKPAISHHLIDTFSGFGDDILVCFSGSGTIPFEASLNGRKSYSIDINPISIVLSNAKVKNQTAIGCTNIFEELKEHIETKTLNKILLNTAQEFGYNKSLEQYYHPRTLVEICLAREFFNSYPNRDSN